MLATMSLLMSKPTTSLRSLGKGENKKELNAETVILRKVERGEREENQGNPAKIVRIGLIETERKVKRGEEREGAEETTDSDI